MTRIQLEPALTPTQALAAATGYGWSVLPHDNGGFFAQSDKHCMTVVFNEDRTFRCASIRQGADGMAAMVPEDLVVGRLARHGKPLHPTTSGEGPDCRRCGKPTGKWWLWGTGPEGDDRALCPACDAVVTEQALALPERQAPSEEKTG